MNYNEMAREYEISANEILKKITDLKTQKENSYGTALKDILRRIKILEDMYIDCNFTAKVMYARASNGHKTANNGENINEN